jgi:hypothetical protein
MRKASASSEISLVDGEKIKAVMDVRRSRNVGDLVDERDPWAIGSVTEGCLRLLATDEQPLQREALELGACPGRGQPHLAAHALRAPSPCGIAMEDQQQLELGHRIDVLGDEPANAGRDGIWRHGRPECT